MAGDLVVPPDVQCGRFSTLLGASRCPFDRYRQQPAVREQLVRENVHVSSLRWCSGGPPALPGDVLRLYFQRPVDHSAVRSWRSHARRPIRPREPRRRPHGDGEPPLRVGRRRVPVARRGAPQADRRGRGAPGAAQRGVQGDRRAHEGRQARRGRGRQGAGPAGQRANHRARGAPRRGRGRRTRPADDGAQPPGRIGARRRRRDRQRRGQALGHAAGVRLRAEGALGPRPRARHLDFERAVKLAEVALRSARRDGREAQPRAHQLHARHARRGRLHGVVAAGARQRRDADRHRPAARSSRTTSSRPARGST